VTRYDSMLATSCPTKEANAEVGHPVARLVPIDEPIAPRVPGNAADQVVIADDFDAPLPESVLGAFEQ
jgi:antitoxin (DNA-binding transcriptional repressor) of toxin-antitoxin stability system